MHSMGGPDNRPAVCIYRVGHVCAQSSQARLSYPHSIMGELLGMGKKRKDIVDVLISFSINHYYVYR